MLHSYPSVYAIGHKAIENLFANPVIIEEKIDGSQFSMARIDGELYCRSKGKELIVDAPEQMFVPAVAVARSLDLHPGWVYRGEFLAKPKHNTLAYSRIPHQYIILFDINPGLEEYLSPADKQTEVARLGLECVPCLYEGMVSSMKMFQNFLERESILGGTKIEGVVVKNYSLMTGEKKVAMGKYVSEAFKETNAVEWRKANPTQSDIVQQLIERYRTPARWQKAVQHLRDDGKLESSPRDIGPLIRAVPEDVLKECEEEIKNILLRHFWKQVQRGLTAGLPEWYKEELARSAFPPVVETDANGKC